MQVLVLDSVLHKTLTDVTRDKWLEIIHVSLAHTDISDFALLNNLDF
jgi:hypothetical protein